MNWSGKVKVNLSLVSYILFTERKKTEILEENFEIFEKCGVLVKLETEHSSKTCEW